MEATISGQRDFAIVRTDDNRFRLLRTSAPGELLSLDRGRYATFFRDASDIEMIRVATMADVVVALQHARQRERALQLFLMCLDASFSTPLRRTFIRDLDHLLEVHGVRSLLEGVLYYAPLPPLADRSGMLRLAKANHATRTLSLLTTLLGYQHDIRSVHTFWNDLPDEVFETPHLKARCTTAAVFHRYFRSLLSEDEEPVRSAIMAAVESLRLELSEEFCATFQLTLTIFASLSPSAQERPHSMDEFLDEWNRVHADDFRATRPSAPEPAATAGVAALLALADLSDEDLRARMNHLPPLVLPDGARGDPFHSTTGDALARADRLRGTVTRLLTAWDPTRDTPHALVNLLDTCRALRDTQATDAIEHIVPRLSGHPREHALRWLSLYTLMENRVYAPAIFEQYLHERETAPLCLAALCRYNVAYAPHCLPRAAAQVGGLPALTPTISQLCFQTFTADTLDVFLSHLLLNIDLALLPALMSVLRDIHIRIHHYPLAHDSEFVVRHSRAGSPPRTVSHLTVRELERLLLFRGQDSRLAAGAKMSLSQLVAHAEAAAAGAVW